MTRANVIPLRNADPALEEEARTAVRLATSIRNADSNAETELVERYSHGLGYLLTRRIGDKERARDLLQETFCIAIEKLRKTDLDNPERLAGYLRGIAVRVALNAGRRRQREPSPIDIDVVAAIPDPEPRQFDVIDAGESSKAIHKFLNSMSVPRDREILLRFYVYDQDKDEICSALKLNRLHFNRVLYRAKGRFRKILENSQEPGNHLRDDNG